ncbi:uncharacterized protein LOC131939225 [Physella acuta]|uniref:uncharacterized protein LOC131939225 n=1 Tax=Physella acuta TaxID=109671 RepID=UPI0027DBCF68|nr:uncharacterized protein LOC131939225 [Physella acuta]
MFEIVGVRKVKTLERTKQKIYLATLEEDPTVKKVLKVFKNTKRSYQAFLREVRVLEKICHPNVMVYEISMSFPKHNVIGMPYCELGALYNMIGMIGQRQIDHYLLQMCSAVKYLHGQNIVHRDIKLDNILLDAEHHLYITDFDMSCKVQPGCVLVNRKVGTVPYMAPEMLQNPEGWYDGFKLDMYALGVVLWCLLFQCDCDEPEETLDYLKMTKTFVWPFPMLLYKNVLENLLHPDPASRWDISQLIETLGEAAWLAERVQQL